MTEGRNPLQSGAWAQAKASFEEALRDRETPEALMGLVEAASWLGDGRSAIEALERAFRLFRERGEDESAARAAAMVARASERRSPLFGGSAADAAAPQMTAFQAKESVVFRSSFGPSLPRSAQMTLEERGT